MYLTIVVFGATYEQGVYIDSFMQSEWAVQARTSDLMGMLDPDDEAGRNRVYESMPPDVLKAAKKMQSAYSGMRIRAQVNGQRLRGPYTFNTDEPLAKEFLVEWAKENVFQRNQEGD